jgi:FemAB-related protein (PEP-CTERM system-associated)
MRAERSSAAVVEPAGSATEWDAFVTGHPAASHMHRHAWAGVFERVFGHRSRMLVARDADHRMRGVLPLTFVRSVLFGRHAVSVPYLNYGGPIGDEGAIAALVESATDEAVRLGYPSIELRSRDKLPLPIEASTRKVTVVLDLPDSSDTLLRGFDAKLRSQVRRATKEGARVEHGLQELPAFYSVFERHMRDLGTPVMPRRFFEDVAATFPESTWIATVRFGDVPIAGAMGFRWREEFEITWASALMQYKRMSPNMLLYWGLLTRCVEHGVARFNFGRTTPGSGPHRFKLQWGGREESLHWYHPGARGAHAVPQKEQAHFALASRIWRRLPLTVASALGPRIVRGIP